MLIVLAALAGRGAAGDPIVLWREPLAQQKGLNMTISSLRPAIFAASLIAVPNTAQAELTETPSYNWIAAGYLWNNSGEDALSDPQGFAIGGSFEPTSRLIISLSTEYASSELDPQFGELDLKGRAIVGTVGTYWPLSDRVHLTAGLGVDYERIELESTGISVSEDLWFANAVAGITIKPNRRLELGASVQRLEAINDAADGESNWVLRGDAALAITNNIDLVTSIAYENDEPGAILGARWRF